MNFTPVPTRASRLLKKREETEFKAVVFEEPKPASQQKQDSAPQNSKFNTDFKSSKLKSKAEEDLEFDIKKARHEVLRFAMNNQRLSKNKKKMEILQAIKLGAKPRKRPYKNYKDLQAERKRLKDIREKRKELGQLGKNQAGAASVKCRSKTKLEKSKKKRAPVTAIDQHYGKVVKKFK